MSVGVSFLKMGWLEKIANDRASAVVLIAVAYSLSWFFLLSNISGIYWDDWTLVDQNPEDIKHAYQMVGGPLTGEIHVLLLSLGNQVFPYRLLTFLSYFLISICSYGILRKVLPENNSACLLVALIIATFPVNSARVALINNGSAYSLAAFVLATYLAINFRRSVWLRSVSLGLYFLSFFVESLLVFYAVPYFLLLYTEKKQWYRGANFRTWKMLIKAAATRVDYLLLPFVFFVLKNKYLAPEGLYSNYNVIKFESLFSSVIVTVLGISSLVWTPIYRLLSGPNSILVNGILSAVFFSLLLIMWKKGRRESEVFWLLVAGLVMLFLALYPYVVVNKMPKFFDWSSRHQILIPFGAGLTVYSSILLLLGRRYLYITTTIFVIASVLINANDQLNYHVDAAKQESIIMNMRKLGKSTMPPDHIYVFVDETRQLNTLNRRYRFYEFNGLMKSAFGDESRLGVSQSDVRRVSQWLSFSEYRHYNFGDFDGAASSFGGEITIRHGASFGLSTFQKLEIVLLRVLYPEKYVKCIEKFVILEFEERLDD